MNRNTIVIATALLAGASALRPAVADPLDREQTRDVISGSKGTHYDFEWASDGTVTVRRADAEPGAEPYGTGTWRIKEVKKTEDMTDAEVAEANAALDYVYCHQVEGLWHGREMCWEVHQVTFAQDADEKRLPTQTYKVYREAGAETGEFVITRGTTGDGRLASRQ